MITDGDTMRIAAQILDNLTRAAEGRLGVDNPFTLPERCQEISKGLGLGEPVQCAFAGQPLFIECQLECIEEQAPEEA